MEYFALQALSRSFKGLSQIDHAPKRNAGAQYAPQ